MYLFANKQLTYFLKVFFQAGLFFPEIERRVPHPGHDNHS